MPIVKANQLTIKTLNELQNSNEVGKLLLDGNNLYIKKTHTSLSWYYRVAFNSKNGYKSSWIVLGKYPTISLVAARDKATTIRNLIAQGIDPKTYQTKLSDRLGKTLGEVLAIYQEGYYRDIKPNTKKNFENTIRHFNNLLNVPIESINEYDISDIADMIKRTGSLSVASYFIKFAKRLFSFAKQEGYLLENRTRDLKFTYSFKVRDNYLQPNELATFIKELVRDQVVKFDVKVAIYSLVILMLRRSELIEINWSNVDLTLNRLVIPRTKTISNFTILLPKQIISLWSLLGKVNGFTGPLFKFTDKTLYRHITELSIKYNVTRITPHDLRRTAMTLLAEHGYNYLVIDSALAHTVKGINKSYLKSNLLKERGQLLEDYVNYIDKLTDINVVDELLKTV